ncbi:MAG: TrbC family F-type conjugative pilus assembly protein [Halochromatium sp.]|uniref:TrbC family F-type conjugative pilus assembly protein n=1 Tax=Halochromatium sp. TaxID=2049430 RepID=UPI00397D7EEF
MAATGVRWRSNRCRGERMRCSEACLQTSARHRMMLAVCTLCAVSIATAEDRTSDEAEQGVDQALAPIRTQAEAIAQAVEGEPLPAWLRVPLQADTELGLPDPSVVEGLLEDARQRLEFVDLSMSVCESLATDCARDDRSSGNSGPAESDSSQRATGELSRTYLLFASRSLGEASLRELFALASGRPELSILFRGVDEGESLIAFAASLRELFNGLDPPPNVQLDPTPFRTYGVTAVPTLIALERDGTDWTKRARVAGLMSTDWLEQALDAGRQGDFGTRGSVTAIREPDLLVELERRLATLDLSAMKTRALERAFGRLRLEHLPVATEDRIHWIDPTLTAAADIRLPDGAVLVAAGESVNPLEQLPFTQRLVVFDATDARQVDFAQSLAAEPASKASVFLLTDLPREPGWAGLEQLMTQLDRRVFLLTPALRRRFALERVPAVVEAEGLRFRITETAMPGASGRSGDTARALSPSETEEGGE